MNVAKAQTATKAMVLGLHFGEDLIQPGVPPLSPQAALRPLSVKSRNLLNGVGLWAVTVVMTWLRRCYGY